MKTQRLWLRIPLALAISGAGIAEAQQVTLIRQFGTSDSDEAFAVAEHAGNIYVGGSVRGALSSQSYAGHADAFLRKYSAAGVQHWTRQFGSEPNDSITGVAANADGVYAVGVVDATPPGFTGPGGFVRKYDSQGNTLWTHEFPHHRYYSPSAVVLQGAGVYVAGSVYDFATADWSMFLVRLDSAGRHLWTRWLGGPDQDMAHGVAADASGIYVSGETWGELPGAVSKGALDAFVVKYSETGDRLWVRQFGTADWDGADSVAADSGGVYVGGWTYGALPNQTSGGDADAYVRKYDADGQILWTRQFGTSDYDSAHGVAVDAGAVFVTGGMRDNVFVRKFDGLGQHLWTNRFSSTSSLSYDGALGVAAANGKAFVVGYAFGALPQQTHRGGYDAFLAILTAGGLTLEPSMIVDP